MASNTPNINLYKKDPVADGNDTFNIKTMLNDNWDKIDSEIGDIKSGIEAIEYPVTSVNNKTGDVVLNAADIGAETPVGSQTKANVAENNANDYTDQEISSLTQSINQSLNNKVDKVTGKVLSTNDYTTAEKNKLAVIEAGAQKNTVTSVAGRTGVITLTKNDVALNNVQNYPIATQAQAELGTADNVYVTPIKVAQAIKAQNKGWELFFEGSPAPRTWINLPANTTRIRIEGSAKPNAISSDYGGNIKMNFNNKTDSYYSKDYEDYSGPTGYTYIDFSIGHSNTMVPSPYAPDGGFIIEAFINPLNGNIIGFIRTIKDRGTFEEFGFTYYGNAGTALSSIYINVLLSGDIATTFNTDYTKMKIYVAKE